ncbi:hypothetical protein GJ744_004233 [Endocarpon pusillum]|uniref:Uncharacterized protein n=1 Tax=Endocarpon pusillum TaxID=364733 RepID=A0A8H7DZB4_9EURO|nr:hypothetical protein GJ744_004233 [Endocarpon pusillum]
MHPEVFTEFTTAAQVPHMCPAQSCLLNAAGIVLAASTALAVVQRLAGICISDFTFLNDGSSQASRLPSKLEFYFDTDFKHEKFAVESPYVSSDYELTGQHSSHYGLPFSD